MSDETKTDQGTSGKTSGGKGKKLGWAALVIGVVLIAGAGAFYKMRGPSGATTAMGGSIPAAALPELPAEASKWVNGAPVSVAGSRGSVIFVEGWHPA
jgi:hypothetical protein